MYNSENENCRKHTLYAGTTVLQARVPLLTESQQTTQQQQQTTQQQQQSTQQQSPQQKKPAMSRISTNASVNSTVADSSIDGKVIGIAVATGTNTSKGNLVSSILYPQRYIHRYAFIDTCLYIDMHS